MSPKPKIFFGWIVVFLGLLTLTTYGLFYSYGVFLESLEARFQTTRAAISAVYTVYLVVYCTTAVPMGWLSDKYGPRKTLLAAAVLIGSGAVLSSRATEVWQLYLSFGVLASLGHGAVYVVPTATINRWFVKKRGLAVGMALSGLGVGLLVVPSMTERIIAAYNWQTAFVVLGGMFFAINALVALFISARPSDKGLKPYGETGQETTASGQISGVRHFTLAEALRTKVFWLLYIVPVLNFGAEQMVIVHVVPYSGLLGISAREASLGLAFLGIGTMAGRIISGAVSDRIGRIPTLIIACIIEAVAIFLFLTINGAETLYLNMLFLGLGYGGWAVMCSVTLSEFFGLKNLGVILGVWFTSGAWSGILGPLMGGIVYDLTRSYFIAFLIAGGICVLATILASLIKAPRASGSHVVKEASRAA